MPTTCSRPSTNLTGLSFVITVPTTCSRPSTKMSAFMFFFFFTVPTTCSRPSTKMTPLVFVFFRYILLCRLLVVGPVLISLALVLVSFSVAGALVRPFESKSWKFVNGFGGGQRRLPRYTIFCVPHCVGVVAHGWF